MAFRFYRMFRRSTAVDRIDDRDDIIQAVHLAQTKLQNDMSALIDKCQQLGVEPFGFGAVAVRQLLTFADWNQYDWRERFAAADVQIQVELMETNL